MSGEKIDGEGILRGGPVPGGRAKNETDAPAKSGHPLDKLNLPLLFAAL